MVLYKFVGKKGHFYEFFSDDIIKLNFNCPKEYKDGEGQGSCKGYKSGSEKPKNESKQTNESSKPKSVSVSKILTAEDYKSASPEQKAKFLRSEVSKGKKSTQLPDGTMITNINSKLKSIEKKLTTKLPNEVTIGNVKSVIDKVKKEQTSGKVSKETINELRDVVNIAKNNLTTKSVKTPSTPVKSGKGLDKIRSEIEKVGGPEEFFKTADTHSKGQDERKPIDSEQMERILTLYTTKDTFKNPYKEENGIKWYKQDNDDTSVIVAKVGKKVAAYAIKAADSDDPDNPYTTIVSSMDFKGKGIGKKAMLEFYDNYPDMIKKTGGLTPMGKKAYLDTLKSIVNTNQKQNMSLEGFTTTADLDRQFEAILKSIEPDVMKLAKKIPAAK